jgi:hypothetical protein
VGDRIDLQGRTVGDPAPGFFERGLKGWEATVSGAEKGDQAAGAQPVSTLRVDRTPCQGIAR